MDSSSNVSGLQANGPITPLILGFPGSIATANFTVKKYYDGKMAVITPGFTFFGLFWVNNDPAGRLHGGFLSSDRGFPVIL